MTPLGIDPGALLERPDGTRELLECVLERLADGRLVQRLFDDEGDLVMTISLRPDFYVRVEHESTEAAA